MNCSGTCQSADLVWTPENLHFNQGYWSVGHSQSVPLPWVLPALGHCGEQAAQTGRGLGEQSGTWQVKRGMQNTHG